MTDSETAGSYFLSYSRSDERFALRLARDLRAHGVAMWVDQFDIRPSEHWDRAIERAVRDCRGILVILSPRSVASENVADEISYAIDSGKSVLPVMIERCVLPLRITRMHVIDATGSYEKALQQCLSALRNQASNDAVKAPPPGTALDAQVVATAKLRLAELLGPIAPMLVDKAARRASSHDELYALLSQHIEKETDRGRFLAKATPRASAASAPEANDGAPAFVIAASELDSIAAALTRFLGPIAPIVAKRESRASGSLDELRQRLATLIPSERDRAEFLRRVAGQ